MCVLHTFLANFCITPGTLNFGLWYDPLNVSSFVIDPFYLWNTGFQSHYQHLIIIVRIVLLHRQSTFYAGITNL
jgi:hypothetical protein